MRFSFYSKDVGFDGELCYIQDEHSLLYKPHNTNIGVTIQWGTYTGLDTICETSEIVHISGFSPKGAWIKKTLDFPASKKGCLFVHFDMPPAKGTAIEYGEYWETYYDDEKQLICIGDSHIENGDDCVEFANNIIAVLRDGDVIAIFAKIKEV